MVEIINLVAQAAGLCLAYPHTLQKAAAPADNMRQIGVSNGIYQLFSNIVYIMYLLRA